MVVFLLVLSICAVGCSNKFWDPTQVGRFKPVPAVNVILDSLGVAEETPAAWESGEEPKPVDVVAYDTDYVFGPGDTVIISYLRALPGRTAIRKPVCRHRNRENLDSRRRHGERSRTD